MRSSQNPTRRLASGNSKKGAKFIENLETRQLLTAVVGHVYADLDGSGTQSNTETNIAGVRIYDDVNHSGAFDDGEPAALTNAQGIYNLPLSIGTHRLRQVVPAGYTQTAPATQFIDITLADGQTIEQHFGDKPTSGVVAGVVYNDADSSGTRSSAEVGLGGWTVFLDANANEKLDAGEASTVSNANGTYYLTSVAPGTYSLREVVQTGWSKTQPTTGGYPITLAAGQVISEKPFGNHKNEVVTTGSITGVVYNDSSNNGAKEAAEVGLSGWTVYLDTNNNGALDAGEKTSISTPNGAYSFTLLAPGTYRVREVVQAGWTRTQPTSGQYEVVVTAGVNAGDKHFGNHKNEVVTTGAITGIVYNDASNNGAKDAAEVGLSGWTVYLDANNNGVLDTGEKTATSSTTGAYSFTLLAPGTYRVREVVQAGWTRTQPTSGQYEVVVTAGATFGDKHFGNHKNETPAVVAGTVYNDANNNGVRESTEVGLGGWTVFLDANANEKYDDGEQSTLSNANGTYYLTNVTPGTYTLREVVQTGWTKTQPTTGGYAITIAANQAIIEKAFGNHKNEVVTTGAITGVVYNDASNNGAKEAAEVGLSGWTVYLDANNNGVLDTGEKTATSSSTGAYSFTLLAPGTYHVREVVQTGWTRTQPTSGQYEVVVTAGATIGDKHFGNHKNEVVTGSTIVGNVYNDVSANGKRETNEAGLANWTIYIDANNNEKFDTGEKSALTDSTGKYTFAGLTAGTYRIREVLKTGWRRTQPTASYYDVVLPASAAVVEKNFGNTEKNYFIGRVFLDKDANNVFSDGDVAQAGVKVFLDTNNNGLWDDGETWTTTSNTGYYTFNVPAGTFHIREIPPVGQHASSPASGLIDVTVTSGKVVMNLNFANRVNETPV